jgi:type IV pilus assembly protein PilQ
MLKRLCFLFLLCYCLTGIAKNAKPLSFHFSHIPVRDALQKLAAFSDKNLIISDAAQGEVTLNLKNVSFDQALNLILSTQGLAKRQIQNTLYIAPTDVIAKQNLATQNITQNAPLHFKVFRLRYAKAPDISPIFKHRAHSLLSKRGAISVDTRTNSLLISDTETQLAQIARLIRKLDIPVKQILISARIVNIDHDYEKSLGVRFGLSAKNHVSGTLSGANSLAGHINPHDITPKERLNVDLPVISPDAASLGLALFSISKNVLLDLELSALETEGHAEIISSPKLLTSNQQSANIEAGQEIPYQERAYGGNTTIAFKKAVLSLKVTPQIIPDGKILLHLQVNQDKRSGKEILGVPAIDTRQIKTSVLVNNNETVVLGGIYEKTTSHQVDRVPFFGSLPIVGALFRHKTTRISRRELLIFVTPHIVAETSAPKSDH